MPGRYLPDLLQTDAFDFPIDVCQAAVIELSTAQAAAADDDAILAAFTVGTTAGGVTKTTFAAQPPYPRNVTMTSTGTAGNVKAGKAYIYGIAMDGSAISEEITITADTHVAFTGTKAFVKVTKVFVPVMDGNVSFKVGFGDLYGLPYKLATKPLCIGSVDGAQEAVTLAVSAESIEGNTFTFSSAPAGEAVKLVLFV